MPKSGPGRPSPMDQEENVQLLAQLYADGASRAEMADTFGVHEDTISRWTRRADVQALVTQLRQARANRILRKVETRIEGLLENEETMKKMDLKDLLAIKRDFTPQRVEVGRAGDFSEAAELAMWEALDSGQAPAELPPAVDSDAEEEL